MTTEKKERKFVTYTELKTIIDGITAKPPRKQKDIADEIGRVPSFVFNIIKRYNNGDKKLIAMYNSDNTQNLVPVPGAPPRSADIHIVKPKSAKNVKVPKRKTHVKPGLHGAISHNLNAKYKNLDRTELEFLKSATCSHDYVRDYFKHFGYDTKTVHMLTEVWKRREDIIKYENDKLHHAVIRPATKLLVEPMKTRERVAMIDDDRLLADLSTKVETIIQIQNESLKMQALIASALGIKATP